MPTRVAVAAAFAVLFAFQARARTLHVPAPAAGDTTRAASIALAQAQPGDTIVLGAGTHPDRCASRARSCSAASPRRSWMAAVAAR